MLNYQEIEILELIVKNHLKAARLANMAGNERARLLMDHLPDKTKTGVLITESMVEKVLALIFRRSV